MKRQQQTQKVRRQVVAAAQKIFLQKGYSQTTLREIAAASGVAYGSIYHHFGDKDGVFREWILENFQSTQNIADQNVSSISDPYERLGLKWAGLAQVISVSERMAELMSVAYRSWSIAEALVSTASARHRDWLRAELPTWSDSQFFAATLVLTGGLSTLVDERLNVNRLTPQERISTLLGAALPCFGASPEVTQRVIQKAGGLMPGVVAGAMTNLK